ncbi:MAG: hypothetical protein ACFFDN_51325 [Candidatus Hodarchaeota archaeon]
MSKEKRIELIKKLEKLLGSKVVVLFHSSRKGPLTSSKLYIEQVRYLYDHIIGTKSKKITLFLYTYGGDVNVPLRMV